VKRLLVFSSFLLTASPAKPGHQARHLFYRNPFSDRLGVPVALRVPV